jgi:hypothetical protein
VVNVGGGLVGNPLVPGRDDCGGRYEARVHEYRESLRMRDE